MRFAELTESQQKRVFKEIVQEFMDNGEREAVAFECAKEYYSKTILESNFSKALEKGKEMATREDRALLCFGTLSMMKYID